MNEQSITNQARAILNSTMNIRDTWPDDLPYLWEKFAPMLEAIEKQDHAIITLAKVQA